MHGRDPAAHPAASPPAQLTLAEAVGGRAAHVETGLAAAVLGPVDLGAAGLAAERRVVCHAPGRGSWGGTHRGVGFEIEVGCRNMPGGWQVTLPGEGSPTRLRLVLAGTSGPLLGAEALVLVQPVQARPAVLAGAAGALIDLCKKRSRHISLYFIWRSKAQEHRMHRATLVPHGTS